MAGVGTGGSLRWGGGGCMLEFFYIGSCSDSNRVRALCNVTKHRLRSFH